MDDSTKEGQNYEESNNTENQKDKANDGYKKDINNQSHKIKGSESNYKCQQNNRNSMSCSTWQENQVARTHSRSRSPNSTKSSKQWISSNAFINFLQDFRQNFSGMRSTRVCQLAGERWRHMSLEEKQPYLDAAKSIRNQKHDKHKNEDVNKTNANTEQKKNEVVKKQQQTRNSKERKQSKKNKKTTESDTDSVTSGTTGTLTSDDLSDASS